MNIYSRGLLVFNATFSNVFVIECTVLENKPLILPQVADIICSKQVILYASHW